MNIRIKKLDLLILRSFMGPFVVTFFVVLFAFTMQFYWLYMDELIGKGLGVWLMVQLMALMSATLFPFALPLGILLASIMTFGSLGENYELVAIKSSGISLFRFMRPLIVFIAFIAVFAFFFNNYVIPVTNLKSYSLLYDMRNQKPTMDIKEGIFNRDIDGFAIRVGKKGKDGQTIKDVIIYDHTTGQGNNNAVYATSGRMYPSPDNRYLIFELHNGCRYEEDNSRGMNYQTRMNFGKWYKVFDLSKFAFTRTKEELFKGNEEMMNVGQLRYNIDSFYKKREFTTRDIDRYLDPYFSIYQKRHKDSVLYQQLEQYKGRTVAYKQSFFDIVPDSLHQRTVQTTESNLRNLQRLVGIVSADTKVQSEKINSFEIAWHKKYTLSFACMLLFLIGAPLGAIIRKGGLGMPVVIAIVFFIIYFIISSTGEKLAQQGAVTPWYGMWLATAVLLPIAFVIMVTARNDSPVFNKEWYVRMWSKIKGRFVKEKKEQTPAAKR
ncbi:LptF/LptG family permease [Taibaiella chishuiensis]|uniref:Lipopolysaccharide export system permease protein n=1 Tax=Taibaiella chishuiensis TaxID=1434707 RepID=A0A2P8D5X4_9BACT|nr:LptF/LptG family permease [Taibaiella chishuiensis]PSK92591.1 lipopolysaccharide export system permease protein [Taibaiella chishuiensis]